MKLSVKQIADLIEGNVEGNKDSVVYSLSKIKEGKGTLSFLSNPITSMSYIYETKATAVIVNKDFIAEKTTQH